jgi:CotH kinase protein
MNRLALCLTALGCIAACSRAQAQDWPEIFDPLVLHTLNLEMADADWQTIQNDETFDIEVPTLLWLDGEEPILVAIRRKSADALTNAPGYKKVSYKIDINELVSGQNWHGLRAVSLDNGDDENVVSEGLAWYLHRVASGPVGYGYDAGMASWVRLVINGVDTGVYVNAEQRDKRFLENRGLWIEDETWLYEVEDLQGFEMDEGGPGDSPTFVTLCYAPFASPALCPTPDAAQLAADLPALVNMQGLLTMAAVDAFSANPDAIFSHCKNFYFADYLSGAPRLHFPWDLDSALGGGGNNSDVYAPDCAYSQILLAVPQFHAQYSQILNDLICGPFKEAALHAFLDALEPVLSDALAADPNNQIGDVAEFFDARKAWFTQRLLAVAAQIDAEPCVTTGVDNDAAPGLALSLRSNPARDRLAVAFSLPDASPALLELFDVTGRRIAEREVGALGAGSHVVTLGEGGRLASGVYLLRLSHRSSSLTMRAAVLR